MLANISNRFYKWAKGWLVLVLLILYMFFSGFLMPLIQDMMQDGQGGVLPLDLMPFSKPDKLFAMMDRYGEYGLPFYRNIELTVDIVYPVVYLLFYGLLISWLFERGFAAQSPMRKLNIMPLGAWFCDLIENAFIVSLIAIYPAQPIILGWVIAALTTIKWTFAGSSILLALIGLVAALKNKFRKQG